MKDQSIRGPRRRAARISTEMPDVGVPMLEYFADTEQFNYDVRKWAQGTQGAMVLQVRKLTGVQRVFFFKQMKKYRAKAAAQKMRPQALANNIRLSTRKNSYLGQIDRIGFRFPLHGIWLHHGVSRSHPASNPRRKVDWFNSVIEQRIDALAALAAHYFADAVVNYHRIKIR